MSATVVLKRKHSDDNDAAGQRTRKEKKEKKHKNENLDSSEKKEKKEKRHKKDKKEYGAAGAAEEHSKHKKHKHNKETLKEKSHQAEKDKEKKKHKKKKEKAKDLDKTKEKKQKEKDKDKDKEKEQEKKKKKQIVAPEEPINEEEDELSDPELQEEQLIVSSWDHKGSKKKLGTHFTRKEHDIIEKAVRAYLEEQGVEWEDLGTYLYNNPESQKDKWIRIASSLPERPVKSIWWYVRRNFLGVKKGPWEQDELRQLERLYAQHGNKWSRIGAYLNRDIHACRDKYRDMKGFQAKKTGSWTEEERRLLREEVQGAVSKTGDEKTIMWTAVASMIPNRTHTQCRQEWERLRVKELHPDPEEALWPIAADLKLLKLIYDSGAEDESEIVWSRISTVMGDKWPSALCRQRWYRLKSRYTKREFSGKALVDDLVKQIRAALKPSE